MFKKISLCLYDRMLSYAVRKNNVEMFEKLFRKFRKTAVEYERQIEKEEERLKYIPNLSEEESKKIWNGICMQLKKYEREAE